MANQYPITMVISVRDAAMLEDLRTVNVRHRGRLEDRITEAQTNLITIETDSAPRRTELGAVVAPIQRLPVHERMVALTMAGLTVDRFQAAVIELDGLNGAISAAKHRIRRLEAERADMSDVTPH